MASGTDGNIISYDASGNPVAVATGSDGQVLTSAGAGAVPSFQTPAGGGNLLMTDFVSTTTETTTTSFDFADLSGLTFTKTPSSTSSKFILIGNVNANLGDDEGIGLRFVRSIGGGSESAIFSDVANRGLYVNSSDTSINVRGKNIIHFIDSPNTTSAVTYKVQYRTNDEVILQANDIPSSFLIQEVKV